MLEFWIKWIAKQNYSPLGNWILLNEQNGPIIFNMGKF